jgi:hypothetical protein
MNRFGMAYFGTGARFGESPASRPTPNRTMASNKLPASLDRLFALGDDMLDGLGTHEVAVGVKQNTAATLAPILAAARAAELAYGTAQVARKTANTAKTAADNAGKVFITNARKRLSKFFGERYSTEWGAAGWPDGSTGTPATEDKRFALIESIRLHLVANPAHASADMDVTAALAGTAHTNLSNARTALDQKLTDQGNAKAARDVQVATLRKRMTGLVDELGTLLDDEDPLWYAFGLSQPADAETPEAPTLTTLLPASPGVLLADWDDALRAERYRVWRLVVGVDVDFVPVATVYDSDATLEDQPTGATVKIRITSLNDAGESLPGPEAEAVVP